MPNIKKIVADIEYIEPKGAIDKYKYGVKDIDIKKPGGDYLFDDKRSIQVDRSTEAPQVSIASLKSQLKEVKVTPLRRAKIELVGTDGEV